MKVLVIGSGGREHAIAWKIGQSTRSSRVFVAPGNAGTATDAENVDIAIDDIAGLVKFAKENEVGLTVVGPEIPLCDGIVDAFGAENLKVFGPSKNAAQLEGSKVFCKNVLRSADVPTADFQEFSDASTAERYVNERYSETPNNCPLVVKADGLAAGKGAIVCSTRDEVLEAIDIIARQKQFGAAGDKMIIEDRLQGVEASILAITDGRTILTFPPAEDHKRAHDGDAGPNTGGMGAYCPTPSIDEKTLRWVESSVLVPTVHVMKRQRNPFRGILYAGMMMTPQGPKVLEYNERPSVCVVMASEGYPGKYEKGKLIRGLEDAAKIEDVKVFHAGTKLDADGNAYKAIKCIRWDGAWCRKDISDKAVTLNF